MSEEKPEKKSKSNASKIIWAIIAIFLIVIGIYYIIRGMGML